MVTKEDFMVEFNQIKQELKEHAHVRALEFWTREDLTHEEVFEAIRERDWLEMQYVIFLGTEIIKYWNEFDREIVTALCRHMLEEANHYEILSRVLEKHGYKAPVATSELNKGWEEIHWAALEKDAVCAIAVWNCSETSTTTTHDVVIESCRRIGLEDLAKCYEKIKKDENFHVGLGETIIAKYMVTEEQIINATEGIRSFRDEMMKFYNDIYETNNQTV
ncbi:hypothetical protein ACIQXQ_17535 [Peribacillus sp. NPDC097198]|uniref:hypothetical protein n=1 Tax=Peribacillus sp. NPDC097198 TaxID=3364397 RepID=UPI0037F8CF37